MGSRSEKTLEGIGKMLRYFAVLLLFVSATVHAAPHRSEDDDYEMAEELPTYHFDLDQASKFLGSAEIDMDQAKEMFRRSNIDLVQANEFLKRSIEAADEMVASMGEAGQMIDMAKQVLTAGLSIVASAAVVYAVWQRFNSDDDEDASTPRSDSGSFVTELARGVYEAIDNFSHISDPDWVIGDGEQAAEMED